ncbi:helix-turn-helix transcriptional regulator [Dactylosporangium sp. NPDC051484]|uniref:helix-turn-helix transcriptional regulator n=1 Tax=Dactylosporangium sp. NPDC051484 TaxID=3154942 RepID=UPI00344CEA2E
MAEVVRGGHDLNESLALGLVLGQACAHRQAASVRKRGIDLHPFSEHQATLEEELRLAVGLTALRERAGLSRAEVAERIGVSQPRVAAIERSANITLAGTLSAAVTYLADF